MSTRAHIQINCIHLYRHCDGYPDAVLPILERFIAETGCLDEEVVAMSLVKEHDCMPAECIHGDEEYFYLVTPNKQIKYFPL